MPQIFTNCSFEQFNKFELVSSQVPSRQGIITGYGPLEQKGFACCYNPLPDQINFMISSLSNFADNLQTNAYENNSFDGQMPRANLFALVLEETLLQLQRMTLNMRFK